MRSLNQAESALVTGSAFIEGWATDDFIVAGALIGFAGAYSLGYYARRTYSMQCISLQEAARCVLFTAGQAAVYGLIFDGLWAISNNVFS
ncbi:MAG: hypothetical protein JSS07_01970 [Proteobacteria bacterium]|nr:hypothetical protein [Pseudomonadota bacterium]